MNILIRALSTISLASLAVVGCEKPPPKTANPATSIQPFVFPEVNDLNCQPEAIKAMPSNRQQEFGDKCAASGSYKPSTPKVW